MYATYLLLSRVVNEKELEVLVDTGFLIPPMEKLI